MPACLPFVCLSVRLPVWLSSCLCMANTMAHAQTPLFVCVCVGVCASACVNSGKQTRTTVCLPASFLVCVCVSFVTINVQRVVIKHFSYSSAVLPLCRRQLMMTFAMINTQSKWGVTVGSQNSQVTCVNQLAEKERVRKLWLGHKFRRFCNWSKLEIGN